MSTITALQNKTKNTGLLDRVTLIPIIRVQACVSDILRLLPCSKRRPRGPFGGGIHQQELLPVCLDALSWRRRVVGGTGKAGKVVVGSDPVDGTHAPPRLLVLGGSCTFLVDEVRQPPVVVAA